MFMTKIAINNHKTKCPNPNKKALFKIFNNLR